MKMKKAVSAAFTLMELLVVIVIISLLAGMLLPVLQKAREQARSIFCLNTHKQINAFNTAYADDFRGYNPPNSSASGGWWGNILVMHFKELKYQWLHVSMPCPSKMKSEVYYWHYGFNAYSALKRMQSLPRPSRFVYCRENQQRSFYGDNAKYHDPEVLDGYRRAAYRHLGGTNLLFQDGHALWMRRDRVIADTHVLFYNPWTFP